MKVAGGIKQLQTVEGTIDPRELLALVRESIHIPDGATARFYVRGNYGGYSLIQSSNLGEAPHDVTPVTPLHFRITWEVPVAPKQG